MKKNFFVFFAALLTVSAWAGERSFKDWLKDLDARLRRTEDRRRGQLTAAASVRGAKQEDAGKLYWKGRKGNRAVTMEELDAFKKAVGLAQEGKADEAQGSLAAFVEKYPQSPLREDADKAMAYLKETPAQAAAAPEAPAAEDKK